MLYLHFSRYSYEKWHSIKVLLLSITGKDERDQQKTIIYILRGTYTHTSFSKTFYQFFSDPPIMFNLLQPGCLFRIEIEQILQISHLTKQTFL